MSRDTRREQNEKLFRQMNEVLHDAAVDGPGWDRSSVPYLCECADPECTGRLEVTPDEWEHVADAPNHYIMIAGHPRSEGEGVVGSVREYEIARKPD